MKISRTVVAAGLIAVTAGLAVLGVLVHYGVTAEYGDVSGSALSEWLWSFTGGVGGVALVVVGSSAGVAAWVSPRLGMRLTAVAIPLAMALGMLVVTPAALRQKVEAQHDAVAQCVFERGPGAEARDLGPCPRSGSPSTRSRT